MACTIAAAKDDALHGNAYVYIKNNITTGSVVVTCMCICKIMNWTANLVKLFAENTLTSIDAYIIFNLNE
jgi:hypothetical protein